MALVVIALFLIVTLIVLIVANLPEICILNFCWSPIRDGLASKLNFYFAILLWFIIQFVIVYIWYRVIKFAVTLPENYRTYIEGIVIKIKKIFER